MTKIVPVKYCKETIELKKNLEGGFLLLAERLHKIRTEELYKGGWDSFASFLADMDLKESFASKYISVYEQWVLGAGMKTEELAHVGIDKLYTAIPLLEGGVEQAYKKASHLKRDDLRDEIYESKNGECDHERLTPGYARCECGRFFKVE